MRLEGATRGTDEATARDRQEQVLKAYGLALDGYSIEAISNVVTALGRGEVEGQSTKWCPTPPELSKYVRSEQARLDAANRPKAIPYQPPPRDYLAHVVKQRQKADELASRGFHCIATGVDHIMSINMGKSKKRSVGSIWFASLQEVWEPPHV